MAFYDLPKAEREQLVKHIHERLLHDFAGSLSTYIEMYFNDADTYIRKSAYIATGRIYSGRPEWQQGITSTLKRLFLNESSYVRQTVINAAGEIGMKYFDVVVDMMDQGLLDEHHSVRNAVIGSVKKMGQKNPLPVLEWASQYLHHPDKEIRREICHGIELRGRTHPQDILPLLKELQHDKTARVRNTLVHVIGQIAYKKGCLETVISDLKEWDNEALVKDAIDEIIDVHDRYKDFSFYTQSQVKKYIADNF
ncbi:MAG: HEAT repeat domain-containing protein [Bacteroidota bacterium]